MKERPIIFSAEMVKAILEGRKTQTRRVCKQANEWAKTYDHSWVYCDKKRNEWQFKGRSTFSGLIEPFILTCPYGQVGDHLWVREAYCIQSGDMAIYKADCSENFAKEFKWYPSIHLPRWASRITLEITDVRVERLQEITEEDAIAEGCSLMVGTTAGGNMGIASARYSFMKLWDSLNAKRGYGWDKNPWVWVIEFGAMGVRVK